MAPLPATSAVHAVITRLRRLRRFDMPRYYYIIADAMQRAPVAAAPTRRAPERAGGKGEEMSLLWLVAPKCA